MCGNVVLNPLNAELNPICHLLALLGAHHILYVSRVRVNLWGTLQRDFVCVCVCSCVCDFVRQKGVMRIDQLATISVFLQVVDRYRQL